MAAAGMCGVMSFTMLSVFSLLAEQTLTLPPVQAGGTALVHAQFRTLVPAPAPQTEVKRLLAEDSPFEIPEPAAPEKKVEPEVAPEPKVAATPKPAPKPEPEPEAKMEPKPERRAKPAPARKPAKAEAVKTPQPKAVQQGTVDRGAAQGASDAAGTALVPGKAAASMPGAAGSAKVEPDKSAALAVLLQAVERHKQYPRQGRRSGAEGTCRLLVHVASDGRVSACSLSEGSGKAVLDAAAKRLGEKLVGLSVAQTGGFQVLIPVHYRLTDG
ncbi:TonB family protein [uncultured Mailhella sp.]|uniref:energy transducer TonB n=1 Tax=uncultured Mailhella sp. TaxID=1981031 RepID=UPI0025F50B96|nr:TonB family protein [uncultured Mailhella sp.]